MILKKVTVITQVIDTERKSGFISMKSEVNGEQTLDDTWLMHDVVIEDEIKEYNRRQALKTET